MGRSSDRPVSLRRRLIELPQPVWVISGGVFVNKLGNFLIVFLMLYLTAKGYSTFLAGMALGAMGLGSFFGSVVGGTVADRLGRRIAIVVSTLGYAGFTLLIPACPNAAATVGLAVVVGFFSRLFNPAAGAVLVDSVPPDQRVLAFGLYRLALNLGMSVGPMLGGLLIGVSYNYLFFGTAAANVAFAILVVLLLPETKPTATATETGLSVPAGGYRDVFADRSLRLYVIAIIATTYVYVQTTATLPLHVRDVHLSTTFYGVMLGLNAVMCVLIELPLTKITGHRHPGRVLAVGMVLLGVGVGFTGAADTRVALLLTVVVWSLAETIYSPVAQVFPGLLAPDHLRGRYQGAERIADSTAHTIGPALGGFLYSANVNLHWGLCGGLGIAAAAIILMCEDPRKRTYRPNTVTAPDVAPALLATDT